MSLPPELGSILDDNKFKKNKFMIPYYAKSPKVYRVHILAINDDVQGGVNDNEIVYNRAVDAFITHYFPEYYPFLMEGEIAIESSILEEIESFKPHYETLRDEIYDSLSVHKTELLLPLPGQNPRRKVVMQSTIDFKLERLAARTADRLPEMDHALQVFAYERDTGDMGAETSFSMVTMPNSMEQMTGVLNGFGDLSRAFQNVASAPMDFNSLQSGTSMVVNAVLQTVYDSISSDESEGPPAAYDTDYITVYFNDNVLKPQIMSIEYFILNVTATEPAFATVGFISNVKYNPTFQDPLTLATLKHHDEILQNSAQSSGLTGQSSITQFFKTLGEGDGVMFTPQIGDTPGSLTPGNNIFGNRSSDDLVDMNDIHQLENLFSTIMTAEEVRELEKTATDPEVTKRIMQKQKATKIKAGLQTVKVIDDILNFNFPLFGPNLTKEGRAVNAVLSQFGIQDLAKEAILCVTLGLGATASRITQALKNSIVDAASSLRNEPTKPSAELNIERPEMSFKLKDPSYYFSVNGDIGAQIKDIILSALANAGFEIVKSLAEMIQLNCGEILKDLAGAVDLGREIRERANHAALDIPNLEDLMEAQMAQYDLSLEEGYTYFTEVSRILDPRQICRLLNGPTEVLDSTIDDLIEFNKAYPLAGVNNKLVTRTAILSYFQSLTNQIDTVTFCNDIINEHIMSAVQSCNICLDTDLFEANPAIKDLIDIAENGITLIPPKIDFLCPESENYLENPVATHILPNLWNNILDTTKIYMAGSIEAARTSLLDATIVTTANKELCAAFDAAGVQMPTSSIDPAALQFITDMFSFIQDISETTFEVIEDNASACADIDMEKLDEVMSNIDIVVSAINEALGELPGVIEEVDGKISSLQAAMTTGSADACAAPHVEYVFPEAFKFAWQGAMQPLEGPEFAAFTQTQPKRFIVESSPEGSGSTIFGPSVVFVNPVSTQLKGYELSFKKPEGSLTPTPDICKIVYPQFDPTMTDFLHFDYNVVGTGFAGTVTNLAEEEYIPDSSSLSYQSLHINPYLYPFVEPVLEARGTGLDDIPSAVECLGSDFGSAYGLLIERMFAYIAANGAFSTQRINNLSFFKNNTNCEPENIGDLFDSEGILDQMKKEFAAAACWDTASNKDKVRNTLYFGLLMMLAQSIIDEFIVKNIIVFTAFRMDEILSPKYPFKEFMITEMVKSFRSVSLDGNSVLEREVFRYFSRLAVRPPTLERGGITHTHDPETPLPGFAGSSFPQNDEDLIRFLIEARLGYTWVDGSVPRSTLKAIQNIIEPGDDKKSIDDVIIEDILGGVPPYNPYLDGPLDEETGLPPPPPTGEGYHVHFQVEYNDWVTHRNDNPDDIPPGYPGYNDEHNVHGDTSYPGEHVHPTATAIGPSVQGSSESLGLNELLINSSAFPVNIQLVDGGAAAAVSGDPPILEMHLRCVIATGDENTVDVNLLSWPYAWDDTPAERIAMVKNSESYQAFMNQTFNKNALLMVPIIYNFYLTNKYFTDITDSFRGTKRAIINFMNMTDASSRPPLPNRPNNDFVDSLAAGDSGPDLESLAREIFLKFLKETPLMILKGLVELIDPHVALSKLIRDITGQVFLKISQAMTTAIDNAPGPLKDSGITGEDLFGLILCLYNIGNTQASRFGMPAEMQNSSGNLLFGPKMSLDGVDFKGSIAGMFMLPPTPFGIIYILLEMLKALLDTLPPGDEEETIEDASETTENEC